MVAFFRMDCFKISRQIYMFFEEPSWFLKGSNLLRMVALWDTVGSEMVFFLLVGFKLVVRVVLKRFSRLLGTGFVGYRGS